VRRRLAAGAANLALLAASLGVTLLAMELLVRFAHGAPPHWRTPQVKHEITRYGYKPVPHQTAWSGGAPVRTNAYGFRGPEWAVPKPPGTFRVMVLGDSLSFGNLVAYEDTFAARLQDALRAQREGGTPRRSWPSSRRKVCATSRTWWCWGSSTTITGSRPIRHGAWP
jgi:hypothetical protein